MAETATETDGERQDLIDELQSLSASLGPPAQRGPEPAYADIPVLLDVVDVPRAASRVPLPPATPAADPPTLGIDVVDLSSTVEGTLEVEARFIVDDLLDELLPQMEARLRERLEKRMRELLDAASPRPD